MSDSSTITIKEVTTAYTNNRTIGDRIDNPHKIANAFNWLGNETREKFICLHLDTKLNAISYETVSIGDLNSSIVHPREVFKAAILANADRIAIIHNHPSGDTDPSREDIAITKRLEEAGELLNIKLIDHVIIGNDKHLSLKEQGYVGGAR